MAYLLGFLFAALLLIVADKFEDFNWAATRIFCVLASIVFFLAIAWMVREILNFYM